jgi:hypothetical protein
VDLWTVSVVDVNDRKTELAGAGMIAPASPAPLDWIKGRAMTVNLGVMNDLRWSRHISPSVLNAFCSILFASSCSRPHGATRPASVPADNACNIGS